MIWLKAAPPASGEDAPIWGFIDEQMSRPVPDKAEVALEYPDKFYVGTFERSSRFEAHLEPTGLSLTLERPGPEEVRKSIHMHLNFGLLAALKSP